MRTVTSTFQPLSRLDSSREVVRQFTPNWFAVTMGTGILAVALAQTPFRAMGEVLWVANIVLFSLFTVIYAARWAIFPGEVKQVFNHPVMAMFFGCIPMGLATIINGFLIYGAQRFRSIRLYRGRDTVVDRRGAGSPLRRRHTLHDVYPAEPLHGADDCGLASASGSGGGSGRFRWVTCAPCGKRADRSLGLLHTLGAFGTDCDEHAGRLAAAARTSQASARVHGGVKLAGSGSDRHWSLGADDPRPGST